jgi:hypothetical protein
MLQLHLARLNVKGASFVTRMIDQHMHQYCGSWAHEAVSAIQDHETPTGAVGTFGRV